MEQGGTRSGKTYNIILYIIFQYCLKNTKKTITITRKTFPSVRASVMRDFISILKEYEMYAEEFHNKSNSEYYLNDNLIEFISVDQPQKIRGRKRDLLFINEANELEFEDWQQLIFRTTDKIIIDYNPSDEYHWIYDRVLNRDDVEFYRTTYLDNPFLDNSIVTEIERLRETDEQYWQVYGLGLKGVSKSVIFTHSVVDKVPDDAKFISFGLDYGYTNDPTALVGVWLRGYDLYIKEYFYQTMMTGHDIHRKFKDIGIGRDSVNAGIDLLKRYKINITKDSSHAIQEFRNYKWLEDKSGNLTNKPEDRNNHVIDAVRYGTYSIISKPNFGKYTIS